MYYRRKVLLALLQIFDNKLEKIRLQKLLMLLSQIQKEPNYHFVPYKYGCFSFQANADLSTLKKYNQVSEKDNKFWIKQDTTDYISTLKAKDREVLKAIEFLYGQKTADELIKLTYIKYPYFAINSTIAKTKLSHDEYQKVIECKPVKQEIVLYTIGYEGITLEEYLNKLIHNGIKVLCDVRNNPLSMKYGFSKNQLQKACEGVGIIYQHFPEVGIQAEQRQELNTQVDYDTLFVKYKKRKFIKN